MADRLGLLSKRRDSRGCVEECRKPRKPQHRPAVKHAEVMLRKGLGDKAHGANMRRP
jgi:hypothetical protein